MISKAGLFSSQSSSANISSCPSLGGSSRHQQDRFAWPPEGTTERFLVRQKYFEENLSELEKKPGLEDLSMSEENMDREALEERARQGSLKDSKVEDAFWQTQRGWRGAAKAGALTIERTGA